jgi:lipoprotein-releasing system permease protein
MYKLLLCLRYLRTRWIALASVVSVTLGVATLIVVNSVMGGFAGAMKDRLHGVLPDVMIEGGGHNGFPHAELYMRQIEQELGDKVAAMAPVVETFGLLTFSVRGRAIQEPVHVIGVDPVRQSAVSKFAEYMHEPENKADPSFEIRDELRRAIESWRWSDEEFEQRSGEAGETRKHSRPAATVALGAPEDPVVPQENGTPAEQAGQMEQTPAPDYHINPFARHETARDPDAPPERGIIVPWLKASFRHEGQDHEVIRPGDPVLLVLASGGVGTFQIKGNYAQFTVVGRFESGMSEYDQTNCYVHIKDLQELRGMGDNVTAIQLKLKDYAEAPEVVRRLEQMYPPGLFAVRTWQQKQGPLLSAVAVEQGILNVLLFMIIAVAGFGILAIFFMIVVEKTRDIGILKSLGASDRGVQSIFLFYGLGLGAVGSGLGMTIGLAITIYLDKIERCLSWLTGHDIFSRDLYYFDRIPTLIDPLNIAWIVGGAVLIAVAASVLPARRAAALRPVAALRYE